MIIFSIENVCRLFNQKAMESLHLIIQSWGNLKAMAPVLG